MPIACRPRRLAGQLSPACRPTSSTSPPSNGPRQAPPCRSTPRPPSTSRKRDRARFRRRWRARFRPERAQNDNVYEAVAKHLAQSQRLGSKRIIASYSVGARERLIGLLADHGVNRLAGSSWQQAQGEAAKGAVALAVLPLDRGFATPELELLTEQDMLGDRLVRRRRSARAPTPSSPSWPALSPGDLVVHIDHGIGRYSRA